MRNGLKDVQARIRKGERGLVVFAGDVTPIDVMCHLPAVCEEKSLPYVYTPSRQLLGTAMGVKRGSLMVLIREHEDYKELFEECKSEIEKLPPVIVWYVIINRQYISTLIMYWEALINEGSFIN